MIDPELPTDLRRPCTPSRGPASPTPRNLRFRGDPGSAVLAHPLTNRLAPVLGAGPRSAAPGHRISRRQSESIIYSIFEDADSAGAAWVSMATSSKAEVAPTAAGPQRQSPRPPGL